MYDEPIARAGYAYVGEIGPKVESAVDLVDDSTHSLLRNEALQFLVMFVEHDSTAVTDAVPQLAALLPDESTDTDTAARILAAIGRSQPDALVDVVPKLELFLETEPGRAHVSILTAIGQLSKEHANITVEVIPTTAEFLSAKS